LHDLKQKVCILFKLKKVLCIQCNKCYKMVLEHQSNRTSKCYAEVAPDSDAVTDENIIGLHLISKLIAVNN